MTIIKNFGFKIFRLRGVKDSDEFLLYDIERKTFNQYNEKRLINILDFELYSKGIDYLEFAIKELSYPENKKKLAVLFEWIYRECIFIDNIGYKPIDELTFEDNNKIFFNIYKRELLLTREGEEGDYDNIKALILNLVGSNEEEYNYFINWIAWQIQNPLKRLPTSIILQGEHGTGKTKFCELILKNIFGNNFCEIGQSDINKEYNEFILGKQIIVANEVIHNDNKFLVPDKLKNFVTDEFLSINRKFKDTIYVRNYAQWIFVTNNDMPLKIEKGDRRYTIFKSKALGKELGFKLIGNLINNLQEELIHFVYYLKNMEVDYNYVAVPLMNSAKEDLIKLSQNSVEEFVDYIKEIGGLDLFAKEFKFNNQHLIVNSTYGNCIPTDLFYELYSRFCVQTGINHKFTRRNFTIQLKKLGFLNEIAWIDEQSKRVILLEGVVK